MTPADTCAAAYAELRPSLGARQAEVLPHDGAKGRKP